MKNLFIFLFLLVFYSITYSQDTLNEYKLDDVKISSNKIVTNISNISLDFVKTYNNDPNNLIWNTPSITFQSDNGLGIGYTYIRLRGFDQTRLNFNWNGIPISDPIDMNSYFNNITNILLYSGSIEINRGIGTAPYGGSSLAGSINLKSHLNVDTNTTNLNLFIGNYGTYGLNYLSKIKLDEKWNFIHGLSFNKTDGYKRNSYYSGVSNYISLNRLGNRSLFYLNLLYGNSRNGMSWLYSPEDSLKLDKRFNSNNPNETDNFSQLIMQVGYNNKITKNIDLKSFIYYNRLNGWFDVYFGDMFRYGIQSNMIGSNIHSIINYNNNKFIIGISSYNVSRNYNEKLNNLTNYDNSIDKRELNGFLIHELKWKKWLLVNELSYRMINMFYNPYRLSFDSLVKLNYNFLTPKINIVYNGKNKWNLSLAYTQREPSRIDVLQGYENINSDNKNEILPISIKPEQAYSVELGHLWNNKWIKWNTNLFWIRLNNEIAPLGKFTAIGYQMRINIPRSEKYGIETEQEIKIFKYLKLVNNITYQESKILNFTDGSSGIELKNQNNLLTPNWIWRTNLLFEYKRMNIGISYFGNSWSYLSNVNDNNYKLPTWNALNVNVGYNFKRVGINLLLNNITDNKIYLSGIRIGNDRYYSQLAGFNFLFNLTFNF